jgi:hypothetical protein
MNITYHKESDVLAITLSEEPIKYAEQTGDLVVHFSPKRHAVLLEFLDASKFLTKLIATIPSKILSRIFPQPVSVIPKT